MAQGERVIIAGAGPAGLVAAAYLAERAVPVLVLESGGELSLESRASTFHPPTLDMLDAIGAAEPLIAQGLIAPTLQYRTQRDGRLAQFDFRGIADVTAHPYRLQAEQFKLTRIIHERYRSHPLVAVEFASPVAAVRQAGDQVLLRVDDAGSGREIAGRWLIGADGARSAVRRSLGIEFEGFTWPERFLVVSTPFDFYRVVPDLAPVSYVADPAQWHFLLQIPGLWRVMFPVPPEVDDERALDADYIARQMARIVPGIARYDVAHRTLYRVHQRVAKRFRLGRVFLVGDAAHVNNPLGGMGMNGGIHDAVNLAERLARVWHAETSEDELDRYERQRRGITVEYMQTQTIENKRNLEARDPAEHAAFKARLKEIAADPQRSRDYLIGLSMIASLRRASELG
ncbi:MAG TPA: FAD-dependent monooxygenase [Stellaceae bacterium]|nr:FAD-dependent monooxygenase [Stellaceae bacterium]